VPRKQFSALVLSALTGIGIAYFVPGVQYILRGGSST
jgi:hypothetical protein